jgi:hypothetical protein
MRRRSFLAGLLAVPAVGMGIKSLEGSTPELRPPLLYPHEFVDTSHHFRSSMECDIFRALVIEDCSLRSYEDRKKMARVMSPVVSQHMEYWRQKTNTHPYFDERMEVFEWVQFPLSQLKEHNDTHSWQKLSNSLAIFVASKMWDSACRLQNTESILTQDIRPSGSGFRPGTVVLPADKPDLRMIGFNIVTFRPENIRMRRAS